MLSSIADVTLNSQPQTLLAQSLSARLTGCAHLTLAQPSQRRAAGMQASFLMLANFCGMSMFAPHEDQGPRNLDNTTKSCMLQVLAEQQAFLRQQHHEGVSDRGRFMFMHPSARIQLEVSWPHRLHLCFWHWALLGCRTPKTVLSARWQLASGGSSMKPPNCLLNLGCMQAYMQLQAETVSSYPEAWQLQASPQPAGLRT